MHWKIFFIGKFVTKTKNTAKYLFEIPVKNKMIKGTLKKVERIFQILKATVNVGDKFKENKRDIKIKQDSCFCRISSLEKS